MRTWRRCSLWLVGVALVVVSGCSGAPAPADLGEAERLGGPADLSSRPVDASAPTGDGPVLVALGDSLTAGLGIGPDSAYPALLEAKLHEAGYGLRVVNAGVSGDTSAGGLRRLDWALDGQAGPVVALIVALGGNDGLRGLSVTQLRDNLDGHHHRCPRPGGRRAAGRDGGPAELRDRLHRCISRGVSPAGGGARRRLRAVPPGGVAGVADLNQADGIHPNAEGAARVAAHLWPAVETIARRVVAAGLESVRGATTGLRADDGRSAHVRRRPASDRPRVNTPEHR